jgi:uncharacterized protein YbjT (DUF2867 family)
MILLAGGTGHLGAELVPLLLARGTPLRVLTRNPERARRLLGDGPEFVQGDVQDRPSLEAALNGVDAVVSAVTGFGPGGEGPRAVDYEGNLNLIRAAEAQAVSRFVLVSIHGAAADHPMELGRMKHAAEESLRQSRLDWVIVRPTVFMQLWVGIFRDSIVNMGEATVLGRGDNPINFASERDVARFVVLALFDPALSGAVIDAGGPQDLTLNQLVEQIERVSQRRANVSHVPVPVMRLARFLVRPFKPDIAGMIEAGMTFDTCDMSFDPAVLQSRFPQIQLRSLADVVGQQVSAAASPPAGATTGRRRVMNSHRVQRRVAVTNKKPF